MAAATLGPTSVEVRQSRLEGADEMLATSSSKGGE